MDAGWRFAGEIKVPGFEDFGDMSECPSIEHISGMARRFNLAQGEARTRPLPKGLHHLRIYVDRSSVEIFVNDGDAVFTTRVFPTESETGCAFDGDATIHMWRLKAAVEDDFII